MLLASRLISRRSQDEELNIFKHDARCLEDYWYEAGEELVGEIYDRVDNRKNHTKTGVAFKTCFVST